MHFPSVLLLALNTTFGNVKAIRTRSRRTVLIRRGKVHVAANGCKESHCSCEMVGIFAVQI